MYKYFMITSSNEHFKIFSHLHINTLLFLALFNIVLISHLKKSEDEDKKKLFRYVFGIFIILAELSLILWHIWVGDFSFATSLPLQLCTVSSLISGVMLITKSIRIYEVAYFWGLVGAIQALLTPDLIGYTFPHYRFLKFFATHGGIVTCVLYMTIVEGCRPQLISIMRTFVITNIYTIFIGIVNIITNGNYLFICHKPQSASIMNMLGPWPWYILSLELVALLLFFIVYIPFLIKDSINNKKTNITI